jgi:hypothetical protein
MLEETDSVTAAIPFGILQLGTDLGATHTKPEEFYRRKLPVNARM